MIIIAGLGNPGPRYQGNRHNIGFMAADEIARRWSFGPERAKFQSVIREGEVATAGGPVKVLLMKPQTFMNESGRAVAEAARFYKVQPGAVGWAWGTPARAIWSCRTSWGTSTRPRWHG